MTKSSFLLSLTIVFAVIVQGQAPKNKVVMVGEDGIRRSAIKTVMPVYPEVSIKRGKKGVALAHYQESANDLGFNFKEVRNVSFPSTLGTLGVTGVPSLLIVDKNGTVSQAWQGR